MKINYTDKMTGEEYNELRLSVDWKPLTPGQANRGLAHTAFVVAARDGENIVAMGRMLFDYLVDGKIVEIHSPDQQTLESILKA